MGKPQWTIADLVDLEFFLARDEGEDLDVLADRDREIYSQCTVNNTDKYQSSCSSASLLFCWLERRRQSFAQQAEEPPAPGKVWQEAMAISGWLLICAGFLTGTGLAFSFLSYSGTRPVNVSAYFALFVLTQLGLLAGFFVLALYRKIAKQAVADTLVSRLLSRGVLRLAGWLERKAGSRVSAQKRLALSSLAGLWRSLQNRYSSVLLRSFFLIAQLFGISFNVGVLAATLLKVIGYDIAFGWQTTLQVQAETVHRLVWLISTPWRNFATSGCPTLGQVDGSQLVLKDGLYHLATRNLVSWWPFLCFSVLCYALLPRLILYLLGVYAQRRELSELRFDHGRCRQLLHRMKNPVVSTHASVEHDRDPVQEQSRTLASPPEISPADVDNSQRHSTVDKSAGLSHDRQPQKALKVGHCGVARSQVLRLSDKNNVVHSPLSTVAMEKLVALVPDEIVADCALPEFESLVKERLGFELVALQVFWSMEQSEQDDLADLQQKMTKYDCGDVLILQEAWQPPIQENLSFLAQLRTTLGTKPTIILGLIGKPGRQTIFTPVDALNLKIWQQKVSTLADPGLQLVELVK